MTNQPRAAKIFISLVVAMTLGAAVLMALDHQSISAGVFSLASYSSLGPISDVIATKEVTARERWDKIEVFYSNSRGGNIKQLASLNGLTSEEDVNFHFLVCNHLGAIDGQIQPTTKWLNQWSALPGGVWYGSSTTIRICVISEGKSPASDYQVNRTEELVQALSRKFNITQKNIEYPKDWQL
ncbi:MAG: N-acetylmuramoyl-L-alanine amidase [Sedimentisphaerales bacterium]|nr:N-acetylmuramoyl-L-alanine amidase [Sedimentisphaerales bacterium]